MSGRKRRIARLRMRALRARKALARGEAVFAGAMMHVINTIDEIGPASGALVVRVRPDETNDQAKARTFEETPWARELSPEARATLLLITLIDERLG